jgi:hypothetical protein
MFAIQAPDSARRTACIHRRSGSHRSRSSRCSAIAAARTRIAFAPPPPDLIQSGHRRATNRRTTRPSLRLVRHIRIDAPEARASCAGHHGGTSCSSATSHSRRAIAASNST